MENLDEGEKMHNYIMRLRREYLRLFTAANDDDFQEWLSKVDVERHVKSGDHPIEVVYGSL